MLNRKILFGPFCPLCWVVGEKKLIEAILQRSNYLGLEISECANNLPLTPIDNQLIKMYS